MIAVAQETWLGIAGALVPSVIALVAAVVGVLNRNQLATRGSKSIGQLATEVSGQLETRNGKSVGEMIEEVHSEAATPSVAYTKHGPTPATEPAS